MVPMPGHQITFLAAAMLLGSGLFLANNARADAGTVTVDLQLRFVDAERAPLANMPVRLRIGTGVERQARSVAATTDAKGGLRTNLQVALGRRSRAMPGDIGSVFASAQKTTWLQVGVELPPFPGGSESPWLWVADVDRFADGSILVPDEFRVWTSQPDGRFEKPLRWKGATEGAMLPDGRRLSAFPWHPAELRFEPVGADRWRLSMTVVQRR
jgi:hypothetical protein